MSCTRSRQPLGGGQVMVRSGQTSSCRTSRLRYSRNWHPNSENWHLDEKIMILRFLTTISFYLCLTLSMSAAARLLVLSPSCRLQVGQCSTRLLQDLQMMWPAADDHQMLLVTWPHWPAGQLGMGRSRGMTRHTGHSTTDSRSPAPA